ncbi:MAG TPA: sulfatase [Capillimicrobium sp.]|nr:sulfatase [Capillimicrobium sp.]
MSALTRRDLIRLGGAGAAGAAAAGLAACGAEDYEPRLSRARDAPNVLLIVTDSTRRDYVSAYNPDSLAKTPNIDALARGGLRFDRAIPEAMPTGLVRRTILTGMRSFPLRDWVSTPGLPPEPGWTPILPHQPILTEVLGNAGVATAYATDNPFLVGPRYVEFRRTLDLGKADLSQAAYRAFNVPFERLAPRSAIERYLLPELSDTVEVDRLRSYVGWNSLYRTSRRNYSAARVVRAGMAALEQLKHRQPFFLGVDAFDPHEPFDPPESDYEAEFGSAPLGIERRGIRPIQPFNTPASEVSGLHIGEETVQLVRRLYAAELTFADRWIGALLDKLDSLGLADNTVVWYLSDHGVLLGERDILGKSTSRPYREIYQVPYVIRDPQGRRAGESTDYYASTHDVARTILSVMGVRAPGVMDGEDLSVLFEGGEPPARDTWTACYQDTWLAGDGRWLLMCPEAGRFRRLYDTARDPEERHDVAAEHPEKVDELWRVLEDAAGGTLPVFGRGMVIGG